MSVLIYGDSSFRYAPIGMTFVFVFWKRKANNNSWFTKTAPEQMNATIAYCE